MAIRIALVAAIPRSIDTYVVVRPNTCCRFTSTSVSAIRIANIIR